PRLLRANRSGIDLGGLADRIVRIYAGSIDAPCGGLSQPQHLFRCPGRRTERRRRKGERGALMITLWRASPSGAEPGWRTQLAASTGSAVHFIRTVCTQVPVLP